MTDVLGYITQCERCGQRAITLAPHNDWVCPLCAEVTEPSPYETNAIARRLESATVLPADAPQPGGFVKLTADPPPDTKPKLRDSVTVTCEICGRTGTRRFIPTPTGWKCSPTATKCIGNQPDPVRKVPNPALATDLDQPSDIPAKPIPAEVTPPHTVLASNITARCKDCTRTFTLTGRPLILAVDMHEMKHGHIVHIIESAAS